VTEYLFDYELFYVYMQMKQWGFDIRLNFHYEQFPLHFEDIQWAIQFSDIHIHLNGREEIMLFHSFYERIKTDKLSYLKYFCERYCVMRKDHSLNEFYSFGDLRKLKLDFCRFKIFNGGKKGVE
jgi:hypothetical protein